MLEMPTIISSAFDQAKDVLLILTDDCCGVAGNGDALQLPRSCISTGHAEDVLRQDCTVVRLVRCEIGSDHTNSITATKREDHRLNSECHWKEVFRSRISLLEVYDFCA